MLNYEFFVNFNFLRDFLKFTGSFFKDFPDFGKTECLISWFYVDAPHLENLRHSDGGINPKQRNSAALSTSGKAYVIFSLGMVLCHYASVPLCFCEVKAKSMQKVSKIKKKLVNAKSVLSMCILMSIAQVFYADNKTKIFLLSMLLYHYGSMPLWFYVTKVLCIKNKVNAKSVRNKEKVSQCKKCSKYVYLMTIAQVLYADRKAKKFAFYGSMSLWFYATMVLCHYVSIPLWFYATMVLCHYGSMLLRFYVSKIKSMQKVSEIKKKLVNAKSVLSMCT